MIPRHFSFVIQLRKKNVNRGKFHSQDALSSLLLLACEFELLANQNTLAEIHMKFFKHFPKLTYDMSR